MTTTEDFRQACIRVARQEPHDPSQHQMQMALYGLGLTGEAGEVSDEIKKHVYHDKPLDVNKIVMEAGDVLFYLDRLLLILGRTLDDAMQANIDKLTKRYPDGFDTADRKFGFTAAEGA